jgi:hypothetical protein
MAGKQGQSSVRTQGGISLYISISKHILSITLTISSEVHEYYIL